MGKRTQLVYTHLLRWEPLKVANSQGQAWIKTLNIDEETGARSALIRYSRGFQASETSGRFAADAYVVEGTMRCGELSYGPGTYHYRPAGSRIGPIESETGVTRVVFSGPEDGGKGSRESVFIQDIGVMPFVPSYNNPDNPEKGGVKVLREDREAGISVLMNAAFKPDLVLPGIAETHDHFEEVYTVEGEFEDYLAEVDGHVKWVPGLYVYREPHTSAHGDVVKYGLPQMTLIRRGWVGEVARFNETAWRPELRTRLGAVEYSE
jgi:hypothetical protein